MILKNADGADKAAEAVTAEGPVESPPPYASSSSQERIVKPSNFIYVDRHNNGISESYVVDPRLVIPASMLSPLKDGEERKNLSLYSRHGNVQVDVTILPGNAQRTAICVRSVHGHVKCKLHRTSSSAFQLEAGTRHGHVQIFLPRTFQGPITATTRHGRVKLSDGLLPHQTPFSEADDTTKFFVGDTAPYFEKDGREWTGDEAVFESRSGHVWIGYEDEVYELPSLKDLFQRFHSKIWDKIL